MLKIGKLTDYALLILSQLSKDSAKVESASSIAELLHLSVPTVSKILKMLAEAKLVTSLRGADGGYRLAKEAKFITLANVIEAMEGKLAMTECCKTINHCSIDSVCAMRSNWRKINNMVQSLLGRLTIVDMLKPLSHQQLLG